MSTQEIQQPGPATAPGGKVSEATEEVRLWGHSNMFYWWVVWLYGFICAGITFFYGEEHSFTGRPAYMIHENPWLGASFLLLTLFVILFSAFRVRGYIVAIAILAVVLISLLFDRAEIDLWGMLYFRLPGVYMSAGFYLIISLALMVGWLIAIFFVDRLTYWRFSREHAEHVNRLNFVANQSFRTTFMTVRKQPVDFLRLALGLFRVRDIVLTFDNNTVEFVVQNAWNVDRKLDKLWRIIEKKPH